MRLIDIVVMDYLHTTFGWLSVMNSNIPIYSNDDSTLEQRIEVHLKMQRINLTVNLIVGTKSLNTSIMIAVLFAQFHTAAENLNIMTNVNDDINLANIMEHHHIEQNTFHAWFNVLTTPQPRE